MRLLLVIVAVHWALGASSQDRYFVFLSDKDGTPHSVEQPATFLGPEALARRARNGVSVTEEDLPVNPGYVASVAATGAETHFTSRWLNGVLVEASGAQAKIIEDLAFVDSVVLVARGEKLPAVAAAAVDRKAKPRTGDEPTSRILFRLQHLGLDVMHQLGNRGAGVKVAVMDAGYPAVDQSEYFSHLFGEGHLVHAFDYVNNSYDAFDPELNDHGTRAFSCLGADGQYFRGGVPEAEFMLFVTEDSDTEYSVEEYNWVFAAEWADSAGVDVISTSLGYTTFDDSDMDYRQQDLTGEVAIISRGAGMASERGILVVASAGNENNGKWNTITPPSDDPLTISVGAVTLNRDVTSFSSRGLEDGPLKPDVAAYGASVPLFKGSGMVGTSSGTSFSTPLVAGLVAGLVAEFPDETAADIRQRLLMSGHQAAQPDRELGHGIPHYLAAIQPVNQRGEADASGATLVLYPNPAQGTLYVRRTDAGSLADMPVAVTDRSGRLFNLTLTAGSNDFLLELDISGLAPGLYVLRVGEFQGQTFAIGE